MGPLGILTLINANLAAQIDMFPSIIPHALICPLIAEMVNTRTCRNGNAIPARTTLLPQVTTRDVLHLLETAIMELKSILPFNNA